MQNISKLALRRQAAPAVLIVRFTGSRIRKITGSRARIYVGVAIMSAVLLVHQDCLFRGSKTSSPVAPPPPVSIAVLPLNVPEPLHVMPGDSARRLSEEGPMLQSLSIASAVVVTNVLHGIPGIEPVPMWRALLAASSMLGESRRVTPSTAAELANMLSVGWAMMGVISPGPAGYVLMIDFIPAKSSIIPFRYERDVRPELLNQRLSEALEQFLRYARHPAPQLKTLARAGDWSDLSGLAGAVDREYGWFSPPAPGKAHTAFAALFAHDPRLASLLFNPGIYAAAAEPAPGEASKPATASGAQPGVKPAPALPTVTSVVTGQEQQKQLAPPPSSRAAEIPENSQWVPLVVPPILSLLAERQLRAERTTAVSSTALPRIPGVRYVLQLFALANETIARRIAQDLAQAGAPAKVSAKRIRRTTLYRVSGGTYNSPATASAAGDALVAIRMADEYWIRAEAALAGEPPSVVGTAGSAASDFQVQVFASFDRKKAAALAEWLGQIGMQAQVEQSEVIGKGDCYRVRLTGYQSRKAAVAAAETLRAQGWIREYWIVG